MAASNKLFETFESRGQKIIEALHDQSIGENKSKSLRKWNLTEAAFLIGRSTHTITKLCEKKGSGFSKPEAHGSNQRIYSLEFINKAREHFGTAPRKPDGSSPAIIAFTNFKGGVAKTTGAVHAAHFFARAGYRTLFIDADSQASATSSFGFAPDHHFKDSETLLPIFTSESKSIDDLIVKTYWDNLDLIPANLGLYNVELTVPILNQQAKEQGSNYKFYSVLSNALSEIHDKYDVIILDCPPSMSILNTNALFASTGLIVPCPPELPDVASMIQFFGMIKGTLNRVPDKDYDFVRMLITKHDGGSMSSLITQTLRKVYGSYMMRSEMYNTQVIKRARAETLSVYELDSYKGSKKTLERAIQIVDQVNTEILELVNNSWLCNDVTMQYLETEVV